MDPKKDSLQFELEWETIPAWWRRCQIYNCDYNCQEDDDEHDNTLLTTSLFSESAPIVVVGDNKGAVTIYRVIDPVTITNEGPLQQLSKLKNAVIRLSDPATASKIDESSVSNQ